MVADGGGDLPEAYNRTFFEAANDPALVYDPQAVKFLVVLGDDRPHSATAFGSCAAAPPDDFGRNGVAGGGDDLNTTTAIGQLTGDNITLLMISYRPARSPATRASQGRRAAPPSPAAEVPHSRRRSSTSF